jgi:hypothetical protein
MTILDPESRDDLVARVEVATFETWDVTAGKWYAADEESWTGLALRVELLKRVGALTAEEQEAEGVAWIARGEWGSRPERERFAAELLADVNRRVGLPVPAEPPPVAASPDAPA